MRERSAFWDNLKGLLICLVVFGHYISQWAVDIPTSLANNIYSFIYLFHMPAFVLCAGYWSRTEAACSAKSITKLILLYLGFNTLMMLYFYFVHDVPVRLLTPYASNWFLLSLITWRLIVKHVVGIKGIVPFAVIVALLVGFWSEASNILSVSRSVAFFSFFLIGYKLDREKLGNFIERRPKWLMLVGWIVSIIAAAGLFLVVRKLNFTDDMLSMQPYTAKREVAGRAFIFVTAALAIVAMFVVVPNKQIPLLTKIGKNSLFIYLVHRYFAFLFSALFPSDRYSRVYLIYAVLVTVITVILLSLDCMNKVFNKGMDWLAETVLSGSGKAGRVIIASILVVAVLIGSIPLQTAVWEKTQSAPQTAQTEDVHEIVEDAVVISFVGDLILLKEQVEAAYVEQTGEYDFTAMFEYSAPYLSQADLAIAVFEGPMAGADKGYSTSNFDDGYKFLLNYPDSFAAAVKNAGIDLVTTANNHVTDMGVDGAYRTLDVLDELGLQHTGSYRNQQEKEQVQVVEVQGIRIAVLSYTFWVSNFTPAELYEQYPHLTSWIPDDNHPYYDEILSEVEADFAAAKATNADLIMVLPHMGTQFSHQTDTMQQKWNKIYADLGADIILGDHAHAVQPVEYINDTLVVNCPGNFANSYISYDGDAGAIVEVYIDRETKQVAATGIIPLYAQEMEKGYFRGLPVYEVFSDRALYENMPSRDLERLQEVHSLVTGVMVGTEIPLEQIQPRYYLVDGQYYPAKHGIIGDYAKYSDKMVYQLFEDADSIVFLGDSITKGSRNNGHPWYEPLLNHFEGKTVVNIAEDSYTVQMIHQKLEQQIGDTQAQLYVVAIGTNDIRYQNETKCAMTAEEYVERIDRMAQLILHNDPSAKLLFLPPWMTLDNDAVSKLDHQQKLEAIEQYTKALQTYAEDKGYYFVDPNPYLITFFSEHHNYLYTFDGIHPNAENGIDLYSAAVLESSQ